MHSKFIMVAVLALGMAVPALAAEAPASSPDGLVEVNSRRMDAAFLFPGADFRPYKKVMLDAPEVSFRPNWVRDMNRSRSAGRVTDADAARILASVSTNTTDIFAAEFQRAGFEVVTAPGSDVLRVRTGVVNLSVNAPDVSTAGRTTTFTTNAGEATLIVEARDSLTNGLLGRVVDRRETRGLPGRTNRVTNTAEFQTLARSWARISAGKLNELKAQSPIPDPLTPGQRID